MSPDTVLVMRRPPARLGLAAYLGAVRADRRHGRARRRVLRASCRPARMLRRAWLCLLAALALLAVLLLVGGLLSPAAPAAPGHAPAAVKTTTTKTITP